MTINPIIVFCWNKICFWVNLTIFSADDCQFYRHIISHIYIKVNQPSKAFKKEANAQAS